MTQPVRLSSPVINKSKVDRADRIDQGSASTTGTSDRKFQHLTINPFLPSQLIFPQLGSLRRHHRRQRTHPAARLHSPAQTHPNLQILLQTRIQRPQKLPEDTRPIRHPSYGRNESVSAPALPSDHQFDVDGRELLLAAAGLRNEGAREDRW